MSLDQRKSSCPAGLEVIPYAADGQGSGEMREDKPEDKRRFHVISNKRAEGQEPVSNNTPSGVDWRA